MHNNQTSPHRIAKMTRNTFVILGILFAYAITSQSDFEDMERMQALKEESQQQAQREAKINAKAYAIAEQMLVQGE